MNFPTNAALILATAFLWLGQAIPVSANPDADKKHPVKPGGPAGDPAKERSGADPLRSLSPKEREKFRAVMRDAWNDPAVLQARDEVKEATMAYQKAFIEAIKRNDPDVVALIDKVKEAPDSPIKSLFSGGGPGGGRGRPPGAGGFRDFEAYLTGESPGFLKKLPEEQQEIYRRAREKALSSQEFKEVVGRLQEMRKSDEAMRNKRIELFGRVRQTLHKQMILADERVKGILPKDEMGRRGGGPGSVPGPGGGRKRPEPGGGKPDAPNPKLRKE